MPLLRPLFSVTDFSHVFPSLGLCCEITSSFASVVVVLLCCVWRTRETMTRVVEIRTGGLDNCFGEGNNKHELRE